MAAIREPVRCGLERTPPHLMLRGQRGSWARCRRPSPAAGLARKRIASTTSARLPPSPERVERVDGVQDLLRLLRQPERRLRVKALAEEIVLREAGSGLCGRPAAGNRTSLRPFAEPALPALPAAPDGMAASAASKR